MAAQKRLRRTLISLPFLCLRGLRIENRLTFAACDLFLCASGNITGLLIHSASREINRFGRERLRPAFLCITRNVLYFGCDSMVFRWAGVLILREVRRPFLCFELSNVFVYSQFSPSLNFCRLAQGSANRPSFSSEGFFYLYLQSIEQRKRHAIYSFIQTFIMQSKITIEIDFENGNKPVIQIISRNSDDVRDKLISSFLQSLGGSRWCTIQWVGGTIGNPDHADQFARVHISPVVSEKLRDELQLMLATVNGEGETHTS